MARPTPAFGSSPTPTHPDTPVYVIAPEHLRELDDICGKLLAAATDHGMPENIVKPFVQLTVLVQKYRNNEEGVSA
jgi:hypothetical protein